MPTASGRETASERDVRQRKERYAAMRAAFTKDIVGEAADIASNFERSEDYRGRDAGHIPAGDRLSLRAGRRSIDVYRGELVQVALADALRERGFDVISQGMVFGIAQGPSSIFFHVTVR
jgi:hypothetical protein